MQSRNHFNFIFIFYKPIRFEIKYEHWFDDEAFSEIKYRILIRRKSLFVLQNYVVPVIIMCILTLTTFFIPFAQGKIHLFRFIIRIRFE